MTISELKAILDKVETERGDVEVVVDDGDPEVWCAIKGTTFVEMGADDYGPSHEGRPVRGALCIDLF